MFARQVPDSFDMISMIVSDEDSPDQSHVQSSFLENFFNGAYAYSRINQYGVCVCSQIVAIATAPAGQAHEFYFHCNNFFR